MGEAYITRRGGNGGAFAPSISRAEAKLDVDSWTYDGSEHAPKLLSVTLGGRELRENQDYVAFSDAASDPGNYNVRIYGIDRYSGALFVPWTIERLESSLELSVSQVTVKGVMGTVNTSVTITHTGDGELSVENPAPQYATVEIVEGNKLKITSIKLGWMDVVVRLSEGRIYKAAEATLRIITTKADADLRLDSSYNRAPIHVTVGQTTGVKLILVGDGEVTVDESEYVTARLDREDAMLYLTGVTPGDFRQRLSISSTNDYSGVGYSFQVIVEEASSA